MNRLTTTLGVAALAVVLGACSMAAAAPQPEPRGPAAADASGVEGGVSIVARDMRFEQTRLTVPASVSFTAEFDNRDSAPHNIAISDAAGASVFKGEIVSAAKVVYSVPALAAGTYPFICEVHPDMQGTITAQ